MKVLHITSWFPNKFNPKEALWISRHIESIAPFFENHILHLEVRPDKRFSKFVQVDGNESHLIIEVPFKKWFLIELITFFLLIYFLIKYKVNRKYSLINFHIAYPLLTYWHLIKRFIKIPVVISEHWSAYHFNFGLSQSVSLHRVKRIFQQKIPVITVSESLATDIKMFSGADFPTYVVPNIADVGTFRILGIPKHNPPTFFMVSNWKWPKRPEIIVKAFSRYLAQNNNFNLRIGGYGQQTRDLKNLIKRIGLEGKVKFLGPLSSAEIAEEMNKAYAFLHCSEYETFSVVCLEALACGCPVVASNVGGIKEYVNEETGILIKSKNVEEWEEGLVSIKERRFNPTEFSARVTAEYNPESVGKLYSKVLQNVINFNL